ncbi:MAG TPA: MBL fold metallo-hydrolase [Acidimicrobiales bacterium]|nr:MBL fold metallo-hydrolase [Acidimicrobiales bacterium]
MSGPTALPDHAIGPACVPGVPASVHPTVTRVTAPNPSMMTGPGTNTYVVGDEAVVVIDPGPPIASHLDVVISVIAGRRVTGVAVTHHHRDHAPAARSLAAAVDAPVVGRGHVLLTVDVAADEGTVLDAGSIELVAWHTPGHASDHLCFFAPATGWLFTGDHLMQGSTVVIRPPDGDLTAYLAAITRVRDDRRVRRLVPGHGRMLSAPAKAADEVLTHRAQRAAIVLDALRAHGPGTAAMIRVHAYADVGPERNDVATATCWAHLLALVDEGLATSTAERFDPEAVFEAAVRAPDA